MRHRTMNFRTSDIQNKTFGVSMLSDKRIQYIPRIRIKIRVLLFSLWYGTLDFTHIMQGYLTTREQAYDCPSVSEAVMMNIGA